MFGDKELVLYLLLEKEPIADVMQGKKIDINFDGKDSNWVMLSKNGKRVLKAALH